MYVWYVQVHCIRQFFACVHSSHHVNNLFFLLKCFAKDFAVGNNSAIYCSRLDRIFHLSLSLPCVKLQENIEKWEMVGAVKKMGRQEIYWQLNCCYIRPISIVNSLNNNKKVAWVCIPQNKINYCCRERRWRYRTMYVMLLNHENIKHKCIFICGFISPHKVLFMYFYSQWTILQNSMNMKWWWW